MIDFSNGCVFVSDAFQKRQKSRCLRVDVEFSGVPYEIRHDFTSFYETQNKPPRSLKNSAQSSIVADFGQMQLTAKGRKRRKQTVAYSFRSNVPQAGVYRDVLNIIPHRDFSATGGCMARVNIEEESWKRIYRLAEIMDCSVREAAGTAACLWNNSQDVVKVHGTREEIIEWASLLKISDELVEKWFSALQKVRFISAENNELFKIHGNDIQLETRIKLTARASKGGKALKKKLSEAKKLQAGLKKASSTPKAGPKPASSLSMQCNSIQDNSKQSNAVQEKSENPTDSKPQAFVAAYCRGFKARWKVNPDIQGKDAGIAGRLAKGMTLDRFEYLLGAFFQMPDAQLVKWKHPISAFEMKLNEVVVFADSGQFTTQRQAMQADDMASNQLLMEKLKREGK